MTPARHPRLIALFLATALCALLAVPAAGLARVRVAVGIGDQHAAMFSDPDFRALHLRKARYNVPWDVYRGKDRSRLEAADAWVKAARKAHVRPLLHVTTEEYSTKAHLPSLGSYRTYVGRLVRHFRRLGVREFGVWNEANHAKEPTAKHPRRAAQYFKQMYRMCHTGRRSRCTVVALDLLDQRGVSGYVKRFYSALSRTWRGRAKVVGIHNYSDTNRLNHHGRGTKSIIRHVKRYNRRTDFWLTETGGVVNLGRSFPCNETRAANRITYMFHLAKGMRHDVTRLYAYNWTGSDCNGFDAGLVSADGTPRKGYGAFRRGLKGFTR